MIKFEDFNLSGNILKAISELGFENPMPIQEKAIPHILESESDLIGLAQTGTGKTAAFGLPIIQKIKLDKKRPQALIVCPTRELCLQIHDDLVSYSKYIPELRILPVFGGASIDKQVASLKKGVHIVVATPGRLCDLIDRKKINITKVDTVILDEADEMLNMGFRDELNMILEETPSDRKTYLFSATMPRTVATIAANYMNEPVKIKIGKENSGSDNVSHHVYIINAKDRYLALKRIVDFNPTIYGIIFCRTRRETQEVAEKLIKDGYNAEPLHGDLSQGQRENVMSKFRIKNIQMLVATDVAARGIDVDDLTHVINFNLPDDDEIYVHRSGRTGRAGKSGISIVLSHLREKRRIENIERCVNKTFERKTIPTGQDICERQLFHLIDKMERVDIDQKQIDNFLPSIYKKLEWMSSEELIKRFVSLEFNRFLEYYKNASDISSPNERRERGEKNKRGKREIGVAEQGFTRFFINRGKKDNLKPQHIIGLVKDSSNIKNIDIGEISLHDSFSFFEADATYTQKILDGFKNFKSNLGEIACEIADTSGKGKKSGSSAGRKNKGGGKGFSKSPGRGNKSFGKKKRR